MQQLTSAISSGDLQGAQSAYATLQQSTGKGNSTGPMAQFLSSVGSDLSNGDLTSAQSALSTFQKAHGGHHHKPAADATSTPDTASTDTASSQTTSSNILDISA